MLDTPLKNYVLTLTPQQLRRFRFEVMKHCSVSRSTYYNWAAHRTAPKRYYTEKINLIAIELFNRPVYSEL